MIRVMSSVCAKCSYKKHFQYIACWYKKNFVLKSDNRCERHTYYGRDCVGYLNPDYESDYIQNNYDDMEAFYKLIIKRE